MSALGLLGVVGVGTGCWLALLVRLGFLTVIGPA